MEPVEKKPNTGSAAAAPLLEGLGTLRRASDRDELGFPRSSDPSNPSHPVLTEDNPSLWFSPDSATDCSTRFISLVLIRLLAKLQSSDQGKKFPLAPSSSDNVHLSKPDITDLMSRLCILEGQEMQKIFMRTYEDFHHLFSENALLKAMTAQDPDFDEVLVISLTRQLCNKATTTAASLPSSTSTEEKMTTRTCKTKRTAPENLLQTSQTPGSSITGNPAIPTPLEGNIQAGTSPEKKGLKRMFARMFSAISRALPKRRRTSSRSQ